MKLTTGVNFINIKRTNISYECRFSSYFLALLKNSYKKRVRMTLMKLTTVSTFRPTFYILDQAMKTKPSIHLCRRFFLSISLWQPCDLVLLVKSLTDN